MHLVVGLGNPGPEYARNRHNVGFMVVDALAARWGAPAFREKFHGLCARVERDGVDALLLKPLTFMNRSGRAVLAAAQFYKVPLEHVVVVHDELDLEFGVVRAKVGGGSAGHNGLKSVTQDCGGPGYVRLRVGIGRDPARDAADYVLSNFPPAEAAELPGVVALAVEVVEAVVEEGAAAAMNRFNQRRPTGG